MPPPPQLQRLRFRQSAENAGPLLRPPEQDGPRRQVRVRKRLARDDLPNGGPVDLGLNTWKHVMFFLQKFYQILNLQFYDYCTTHSAVVSIKITIKFRFSTFPPPFGTFRIREARCSYAGRSLLAG